MTENETKPVEASPVQTPVASDFIADPAQLREAVRAGDHLARIVEQQEVHPQVRRQQVLAERLARHRHARIEEQRAHLAPGERDFGGQSAWRLLEDFLRIREELLWNLEFMNDEWEHAGTHPYRGRVTLMRYLREMTDRDLEASITLRRLLEASEQPVARRR